MFNFDEYRFGFLPVNNTHIMAHLSRARTLVDPLFFGFVSRGKPQA
jgi:hypothetical protein